MIGRLTITARGEGRRAGKGTYDEPTYEVYATKDSEITLSFSKKEVSRLKGDDEQAMMTLDLD